MKKYFSAIFIFITSLSFAQSTPDATTLQETAKGFIRQGDYENAILVLNRALQQKPDDFDLQKDLLFSYYLKRDFAKSMELGKPLVERSDADVQSLQLMGLVYKAIAENKEAEKLYKKGIKKFPDAGVLYGDYAEMIAEKESDNALRLWEKGIEMDPNYSGNYYNACKVYMQKGDNLWSLLYAEIFLNMESFTARSTEIKNLLLDQYKRYFSSGSNNYSVTTNTKKGNEFAKDVSEVLNLQQSQATLGITPESLTVIRTRFILDWYNKYADKYPFRLFEHQKQLLTEGLFEAYNFWLFGPAANLQTYKLWQQYHQEDLNKFLDFIRSKVFKVPTDQHYHILPEQGKKG